MIELLRRTLFYIALGIGLVILAVAVWMFIAGCPLHSGRWAQQTAAPNWYNYDEIYVLPSGRICGEVIRSEFDVAYYAFAYGADMGQWTNAEQAKKAVENSIWC